MLSDRQSEQPATAAPVMPSAVGDARGEWWRRRAAAIRSMLAEWRRRHRSRRELRGLDPYQVRDFCLDPMVAERENTKPFWRE
ncbi:MAG TPA: hypothetical protein VKW08_16355 [Xanthobacteraceae bacterium]|nr:hypothetical protein [Xanthobacteraceae bacterium]